MKARRSCGQSRHFFGGCVGIQLLKKGASHDVVLLLTGQHMPCIRRKKVDKMDSHLSLHVSVSLVLANDTVNEGPD